MKPDLSIVLASYNQKKTVMDTLDSIFSQRKSLSYEVILIDSSPENLFTYTKKKYPSVRGKWLSSQTSSPKARTIGAKIAKANKILFFDTDTVLADDVFAKAYKALEKHELVCFGARNANPVHPVSQMIFLTEFSGFLAEYPSGPRTDYMGFGVGFRRSVFTKYGYFLEQKRSTDLVHGWYLYKRGVPTYFDSSIVISHQNTTDFFKALSIQYWIGRTSCQTRKKMTLPRNIIMDYPILIVLLPFYRSYSIAKKLLLHAKGKFFMFLLLYPLMLISLCSYTLGFFVERLFGKPVKPLIKE